MALAVFTCNFILLQGYPVYIWSDWAIDPVRFGYIWSNFAFWP